MQDNKVEQDHVPFALKNARDSLADTTNQEQNMQFQLTAKNDKKTVIEIYFTAFAAETARKIYEARGYTVTVEER